MKHKFRVACDPKRILSPDSVVSAPTIKLKIFKTKDDEPVNCVPGGKSVTFPSPIFALSTFFSSIFHRKSPPPPINQKLKKTAQQNPTLHPLLPSPPPPYPHCRNKSGASAFDPKIIWKTGDFCPYKKVFLGCWMRKNPWFRALQKELEMNFVVVLFCCFGAL